MEYKFFTNDEANYISEMYKGTNSIRKKRFEEEFFDLHYNELIKGCIWEEWFNDIIKNPLLTEDELLKCKIGVINQVIYISPIKTDSDLEYNKYNLRLCLANDKVADNLYINLVIYILYSETYSKIKNMDDFHSFITELSFIMNNDIIRNYIERMALNKESVRKAIRKKIIDFLNDYKKDGMSLFENQNKYFLEIYKERKAINDDGITKFREALVDSNKDIISKIISNELYSLYNMQDFPLLTTIEQKHNLNTKFDKAYLINRKDYKESNRPPKGYESLKYSNYELIDYYNIANEDANVFRHKNEFDIVDILSHYYLQIKSYNQQYKFRSFPAYLNNDKEMITQLIISNFKFHINQAFLRVTKNKLPIIDSYFIEGKALIEDKYDYDKMFKILKPFILNGTKSIYKSVIENHILPKDTQKLRMIKPNKADIVRFADCFEIPIYKINKIFEEKVDSNDRNRVSVPDFLKVLRANYNNRLYK